MQMNEEHNICYYYYWFCHLTVSFDTIMQIDKQLNKNYWFLYENKAKYSL